jgi:hypothetical protein
VGLLSEWRVLPTGTVIGAGPARVGPALIGRGSCRACPVTWLMTWLNSLWAAAEGITTHDRPQEGPHDSPPNRLALVPEVRDVSAGPGGLFLALAARRRREVW